MIETGMHEAKDDLLQIRISRRLKNLIQKWCIDNNTNQSSLFTNLSVQLLYGEIREKEEYRPVDLRKKKRLT